MTPLLRPRWIAAHIVLAAVLATFLSLGAWQLRRLDERDASNARITARLAEPVGDISTASDTDRGDHRRARLTGTYRTQDETILLSRSHRGISGHHVLTPLEVGGDGTPCGGERVIVDRGWVELTDDDPPVARAAPPAGTVTVEGILLLPPQRGRFGPRDLDDEPRSFRVEPQRIAARMGCSVAPLYLLLTEQTPPQPGEYPIAVSADPLDRGPHLSYALQWFAFALAAAATYAAFARKAVRRERLPSRP
jgi:surfeit locus 1 family protein